MLIGVVLIDFVGRLLVSTNDADLVQSMGEKCCDGCAPRTCAKYCCSLDHFFFLVNLCSVPFLSATRLDRCLHVAMRAITMEKMKRGLFQLPSAR